MNARKQEEVAKRAYLFWEQRGRPFGSPEVDWWRAERELEVLSEASYPVSSFALGPQTGPSRESEVHAGVQ